MKLLIVGSRSIKDFDLTPIFDSVGLLLAGGVDYEFRTTVVKEFHTEDDLLAIAKWIGGAKRYFLQGYKDSGSLISDGLSGFSAEELRKMLCELNCQNAESLLIVMTFDGISGLKVAKTMK